MDAAYFSHRDGNGIFGGKLTMHSCDFQKPLRMEGANLHKASFLNTDLRDMRFVDCDWPEVPEGDPKGRKACHDEIALIRKRKIESPLDAIKAMACGIEEEDSEKVEALYRQMKQKCKTDHNEAEASVWHFNEKEMRRKRFGWRSPLLWLYWVSSGYAERPVRAAVFLIALLAAVVLIMSNVFDCDINKSILSVVQYAAFEKPTDLPTAGKKVKLFLSISKLAIYLQVTFFALAIRNRFRR